MKSLPMAVVALACLSGLALAGPNAGGTLVVHDASLLLSQTDGTIPVCGQGNVPATCDATDSKIDGVIGPGADPAIFKVYAAFPVGSAPRLMGLTWGVTYPGDLVLAAWGMCGNFELNDNDWPASGSGSSVTYDSPQTGLLTTVYWFAGYNYYGNPVQFQLGPNPSQGGVFGDDSVPAILDPIAGYGTMGFDGPGIQACPHPPQPGACCDPCTATCVLVVAADCAGMFMGEGTVCDPNPCPAPPAGACCDPENNCTYVPECLCTGTYLGDGVLCTPNPCTSEVGACCPCQYCTITTPEECTELDGIWMGWPTCEPNPCAWPPGLGACCIHDVCAIQYVTSCEAAGGTYYGDCSHCHPSPCATGVCCYADQTCAILPMDQCTGVFHQEWGICDPNPCLSTPAERTTWGRIKARFR
jgi:hypothetical protein